MRAYTFLELDPTTRRHMLDELHRDADGPNTSKLFTAQGKQDYPELLRQAMNEHDAGWLISRLQENDRIQESPVNAAERFGGTEFNRYYARGICRRALDHGSNEVKVYRARESTNKRASSEEMIGTVLPATTVLDDLRSNAGDVQMGVTQVMSGISVRCGCDGCLQAVA